MLNPLEIEALKLSGFIAIVAVSASVIPGIIIAWIISRKKGLLSSTLNMIVYLPLVLPPVVIGYLLLLLFSHNGIIGNFLLVYFNISVKNYVIATWLGIVPATFVLTSLGSGIEEIIDQNTEINFMSAFLSPEIYLPIIGFAVILIVALIFKNFFFKS